RRPHPDDAVPPRGHPPQPPAAAGVPGRRRRGRRHRRPAGLGPGGRAVTDATAVPDTAPVPVPVLQARKVTKRFGGLVAVHEVDLEVGEREIVGLIGPNGAGKTTFFNCLTGLLEPSSGDVLYRGQVLPGSPAR